MRARSCDLANPIAAKSKTSPRRFPVSIRVLVGVNYFGDVVWAETINIEFGVVFWSKRHAVALGLGGRHESGTPGWIAATVPASQICSLRGCPLRPSGYAGTPIARRSCFPLRIESGVKWKNGVCTCKFALTVCCPAAAVTLLKQHGIKASESRLSNVV